MKKLMIASLVGMSLLLSSAVFAGEGGQCPKQGAQAGKCCQSAQSAKAGWFASGTTACSGADCPGKAQAQTKQQCDNCKEKAQGQAPSGGSSETKESGGSCCQQKK